MKDTSTSILARSMWKDGEGESSHAVNVVLLGVGTCQEESLGRCDLVGSENVHSRGFSVQRLPNLDDGVPGVLQPFGRREQLSDLHRSE